MKSCESYLASHVKQSVVKKYSHSLPKAEVYFTDRFVICRGDAIIEYSNIKKIYKQMSRWYKMPVGCLAFKTGDGPDILLCPGISNEEIIEVIQLCISHNPNIVMENYVMQAQEVVGEKTKLVHMESVESSERIRIGKNMVRIGGYFLVMAICLAIFMPMVMSEERGVLEVILVVALPMAAIGVILVVLGKRRLRK